MGKIVVFTLVDRQPIKGSRHESDENKKLDFAVWHGIKNPFFIREKGGVRVDHRYIVGSNFTSVKEQNAAGEIFNPVVDVLGFDSGADMLVDEDADAIRIQILRMHPNNPDSQYHQEGVNAVVFKEFNAVKEADDQIENIDLEDRAMDILRGAVNDNNRMRNFAALFGINLSLDVKEIYLELRKRVKEDPSLFLTLITSKEQAFISDMNKAIHLHVITRNLKGYIFEKEGGFICEATEKSDNANQLLLLKYLQSKEGEDAYANMQLLIEQAELDLNKPQ